MVISSISSRVKTRLRKHIPRGSLLWQPYFAFRTWYRRVQDPADTRQTLKYVLHHNILLEEYKAIYFYIPKAACSTLKKTCADLLSLPIPDGDIREDVHLIDFPCAKKYQIRSKYRDYYKF